MQSLASPSSLARTPSRAATPAAPAAPAAQTAEKAMAALLPPVPPPSAATTPPAGPAAAAPTTPPSSTPSAAAPAEARKPPPGAAPTRDEIVQELLRQPAARREAPLRLDRAVAPKVSPSVANGYELLRQGDLQAARGAYQSALAADPSSVDATLGIATIEARSGRVAAAVEAYRRALELDPRNETAVAGLAAMADGSRQASLETHLRQDAARTPTSGALRFALGNVLAGERRWSEAQAEYFEAHRLDPGNPDIMHNLAVSLDNLGQARLARDFYRRALDASRSQRAQFDPAAVERRLAELGS